MVATKAALSIRLDALADADSKSSLDSATIGIENRAKLESRLRQLEAGIGHTSLRSLSKANGEKQKRYEATGNGASYNSGADAVSLVPTGVEPGKGGDEGVEKMEVEETEEEKKKREKKEKKERRKSEKSGEAAVVVGEVEGDDEAAKKERKRLKKEAKKAAEAATEAGTEAASPSKKDKKKKRKADDGEEESSKSKKVKA